MKERLISAIIALVLFLPIVYFGGIPTIVLAYFMATVGLFELFRMRQQSLLSGQGLIAIWLLWLFLLPERYFELIQIGNIGKLEVAFISVLLFLTYTVIKKNTFTFDDAGFTLISVLYVGIGFYYFIATRDAGLVYLFYVLFVVWGTDTGAYFVGRSIGKHKLWPVISPNKTIEGALGGIATALAVAILFALFSPIDVPLIKLLIITVILSVFGQIGDLAQSALKRHYGVKDAGTIMPGHGGILDRCDSWLFVLPLFYLLQII